jgi:hypothetical protein
MTKMWLFSSLNLPSADRILNTKHRDCLCLLFAVQIIIVPSKSCPNLFSIKSLTFEFQTQPQDGRSLGEKTDIKYYKVTCRIELDTGSGTEERDINSTLERYNTRRDNSGVLSQFYFILF